MGQTGILRRTYPPSVRVLAAVVALATTGVTFAIPWLDRGTGTHEVVLESEHDPGRCGDPHDHAACLRLGASPSSPSGEPLLGFAITPSDGAPPPAARSHDARPWLRSLAARAPPQLL